MDSPPDLLYNYKIIIKGVQTKYNIDSIQIILDPLDDIKVIPNSVTGKWFRVFESRHDKNDFSDEIHIHHNPYGKNFEIQGQERKFNFEVRKNDTLLFKKTLVIKSEYAPNKNFWKLKTERLELHNMDYVENIDKKYNHIEIRYTKK